MIDTGASFPVFQHPAALLILHGGGGAGQFSLLDPLHTGKKLPDGAGADGAAVVAGIYPVKGPFAGKFSCQKCIGNPVSVFPHC